MRARQVLNPHEESLWAARVAGVVVGSDRHLDGAAAVQWKPAGGWPDGEFFRYETTSLRQLL